VNNDLSGGPYSQSNSLLLQVSGSFLSYIPIFFL
jgi:hypothetical protein